MRRILYVEDNEDNRDLVVQILEGLYRVELAVDGAEGLARALAEPPDLVLLDVSLPVLDGLSCARRMRASEQLGAVPIVAISAHCMVGDRERALAAGCDAFLAKPFRFRALRRVVAELLDPTRSS